MTANSRGRTRFEISTSATKEQFKKKTLSHPPRNVPHRLAASPSLGPRLKSVMAAISRRGEGRRREKRERREEGKKERRSAAVEGESTEEVKRFFFVLLFSSHHFLSLLIETSNVFRLFFLHVSLPLSLFSHPRSTLKTLSLPSAKRQQGRSKRSRSRKQRKGSAAVADLSDLLAEKLDLDLDNAPGGASSSSSSSSTGAPVPLKLIDVPTRCSCRS